MANIVSQQIVVLGELKSNWEADKASIAWIDLAMYVKEVLAAQDTRRFVLGFTLCGSRMRIWEFDRLWGIASEQFDINKENGGLQYGISVGVQELCHLIYTRGLTLSRPADVWISRAWDYKLTATIEWSCLCYQFGE